MPMYAVMRLLRGASTTPRRAQHEVHPLTDFTVPLTPLQQQLGTLKQQCRLRGVLLRGELIQSAIKQWYVRSRMER